MSLQVVSESLPSLRWGEHTQAHGHLLRRQELSDPMRITCRDAGFQDGVIVMSHIAWKWGCICVYKHTILDTTLFKAVMAMNLSELRS
jgi:hypothetical protein